MVVLSHRGYWKATAERNTAVAFRRSFDFGFGAEVDVRDCRGELVVSHDMPRGDEMRLRELLELLGGRPLTLAVNVKADGLVGPLKKAMSLAGVADWFVFDMSVPDTRVYIEAGVPVFARMSEVEREPAWQDDAHGIWLDAFSRTWWDAARIEALLETGKRLCVVSPELHGREPDDAWETLRPFRDHAGLMICTDHPDRARNFFGQRP